MEYAIQSPGQSDWPATTWNMVTITRDNTNIPLIYINGAAVATTGTFTNPACSTNSLTFGTCVDSQGVHNLDGDIWLCQIWSTSLAQTNIAKLYCNQLSGVPWP
jgi:hypothetical protein